MKKLALTPPLLSPETREYVRLITTGRITGIPHIVIVRYVFIEGSFYVLAGRTRSDWSSNAVTAGRARVRLEELVYETTVSTVGPDERGVMADAFLKKYGARTVSDWYSDPGLCLRLTPMGPPSVKGATRGELGTKIGFREWKSMGFDYQGSVAEAFDSAAEEYDFTINQNFINRWIRGRSIHELLRLTRGEDTLLEVGCGTGAEAIQISRRVSRIIATDISERMIEILRLKVNSKGLGARIIPLNARASEISKVSSVLGGEKVRVAYSFNGALNCEPEIQRFPSELSSVMRPGGLFVCSIRNRLCLSEALLHAFALQFDKMAPRKRQPVMVSVGGIDIPSHYYQPVEFARIFAPGFRLRRLIGLPSILPPAYLSDRYVKLRKRIGFIERFERNLSSRFPFNRLGDQSLLVFQKRD